MDSIIGELQGLAVVSCISDPTQATSDSIANNKTTSAFGHDDVQVLQLFEEQQQEVMI